MGVAVKDCQGLGLPLGVRGKGIKGRGQGTHRECHGLRSRAITGTGTCSKFEPLKNPYP